MRGDRWIMLTAVLSPNGGFTMMRRPRAALSAAGLLALSVAMAGCGPSSTSTSKSTDTPASVAASPAANAPVISEAEARALLAQVSEKNNKANAAVDAALVAQIEDESQYRIDAAYFRAEKDLDPKNQHPAKPFEYRGNVFYRPVSVDGQQWFLADTSTGNDHRYGLVIARRGADAPWKIVDQVKLAGTFPALATGPDGNAVAVPATDASTLIAAPQEVATKQAAWLTTGAKAPEAALFTGDSNTDAIINDKKIRSQMQWVDLKSQKIGPPARVTRKVVVEPYPVRALRTADGGAVAFYTTKWQLIAEKPGGMTQLDGVAGALSGNKPLRNKATFTWLAQWMVKIPPKGAGKVTVLSATIAREVIN
jgi:hypothetical protein